MVVCSGRDDVRRGVGFPVQQNLEPVITRGPDQFADVVREDDGRNAAIDDRVENMSLAKSTVIAISSNRGLIDDGYRVTRLPDFKQNTVYYDTYARENVLVTNGTCALDHSTAAGFARDHGHSGRECRYKALECFAIRANVDMNGEVTVATAMRRVNHAYLEEIPEDGYDQKKARDIFDKVMAQYDTKKSPKLVGRVKESVLSVNS